MTVKVTVMMIRFDKASQAPYSRFLLLRLGTRRAWPGGEQRGYHRSQVELRCRDELSLFVPCMRIATKQADWPATHLLLTVSRAPVGHIINHHAQHGGLSPGSFGIQRRTWSSTLKYMRHGTVQAVPYVVLGRLPGCQADRPRAFRISPACAALATSCMSSVAATPCCR